MNKAIVFLGIGAAILLFSKRSSASVPSGDVDPLRPPASNDPTPTHPTYVVEPGESFSSIAKDAYGEMALWPAIFDASRSVVAGNPDLLRPGQTITIPRRRNLDPTKLADYRRRAKLHLDAWIAFRKTARSGYPDMPADVLRPS